MSLTKKKTEKTLFKKGMIIVLRFLFMIGVEMIGVEVTIYLIILKSSMAQCPVAFKLKFFHFHKATCTCPLILKHIFHLGKHYDTLRIPSLVIICLPTFL